MKNVQLHEYTIPFKGIAKKVIYHFSDCHLAEYDEFSTEAEIECAKHSAEAWEKTRSWFCQLNNEPYGELQQQSALAHMHNLLACAADGDTLLLAGDMQDHASGANFRLFDKLFGNLSQPCMLVCGNHDPADVIIEGNAVSAMKQPIQTLDLGDMLVVGIDDSNRDISREILDGVTALLQQGKPILLLMHIPIMTEGNYERLSGDPYFQMNYVGCPQETLDFIELIKANADRFVAVLAGHLHYANNSEVAPGLMQYVSAQGITGNINRYIIGE